MLTTWIRVLKASVDDKLPVKYDPGEKTAVREAQISGLFNELVERLREVARRAHVEDGMMR